MYDDFVAGSVSSPLLHHAILFAACQYADMSVLEDAGFDSRRAAREYFHKRAALLYSMSCETNQLVLLQSLLLMSAWWTDHGEEKETRFWTTCACNLACSMGLHKAVAQDSILSTREKCLWRRIFWTLFTRDYDVAIGLGRAPVINFQDVDVEELTEADFYEAEAYQTFSSSSIRRVNCKAYSRVHGRFMVKSTRLSIILAQILKASITRPENLGEILEQLLLQLIEGGLDSNGISLELDGSPVVGDDGKDESIWAMSLELNRRRIQALNHRIIHKFVVDKSGKPQDDASGAQRSRDNIVTCAARMMAVFEKLFEQDLLKYSHASLNTSLFIALLTYMEEIQRNPRQSPRTKVAVKKVELGLLILEETRQYWDVAAWAHCLFKFWVEQDFDLLKLPRLSCFSFSVSPQENHNDSTESPDGSVAQYAFEIDPSVYLEQWFTDTSIFNPDQLGPIHAAT